MITDNGGSRRQVRNFYNRKQSAGETDCDEGRTIEVIDTSRDPVLTFGGSLNFFYDHETGWSLRG